MKINLNSNYCMSRPIQRVGNESYFASFITAIDDDGNRRHGWVVSDSSFTSLFSELDIDNHKPFSAADFDIALSAKPRPGLTLSADAYVAHVIEGKPVAGMRQTFDQTVSSIDRFVSFDGSFSPQSDMSEFLACWVIGTYATDVFDTVGYIWPNGERGSGKSQCLKTLMSLAFMGQTITSSSSFATVRDEASLGATLGFDDCENVQRMENSKRELLLAGNTKGAQVMFKEPGKKDGQWDTKFMDAFAPRAFTSISLPDDTLASRTVMIPLVRSGDTNITRKKPTNTKDWLVDPSAIRDSLWINVATGLNEIEALKDEVNQSSDLSGRDFDIFHGPLAIALWLDRFHGVEGLFARMQRVMESYHQTKQKNLLPSVENVVLQAIMDALNDKKADKLTLTTQVIVNKAHDTLRSWDITDPELWAMDVQKIGMLLGRLGFQKSASHAKARSWVLTRQMVETKAELAGFKLETPVPQIVLAEPSEPASVPLEVFHTKETEVADNRSPW